MDLLTFFSNFLRLHKSGIDKFKIYLILSSRIKNKKLKKIFIKLQNSNDPIYKDFQKLDFIPAYIIFLIKAGELSGRLDEILDELVNYLQKQKKLRIEFILSMLYPAILTFLGLIFFYIFSKKIFPSILNSFQVKISKMPLYNQYIIRFFTFINKKVSFLHIIVFIFIMFIIYYLLKAIPEFKFLIDKFKIIVPGINKFFINFDLAIFFLVLSYGVKSGLSLKETFSMAINSINNLYLKKEFINYYNNYSNNLFMSFFENNKYIHSNYLISIESAYSSGNLDTNFYNLYKDIFSQLFSNLKLMAIILSVIVLITGSLFIGFIILAFYLTYFNAIFKSVDFNFINIIKDL